MKGLIRILDPIIKKSAEIKEQHKRTNEKEIMVLMVIGENTENTKCGQGITDQEQGQENSSQNREVLLHSHKKNIVMTS